MYQFVIFDVATVNNVLLSYIYIRVDVKKGGNNVVLCLMNNFTKIGYFSGPNFLDLTIFIITVQDKTRTRLLSGIFSG